MQISNKNTTFRNDSHSFRNEVEKNAVTDIKVGNKEAFASLLSEYMGDIRAIAHTFELSRDKTEDLVQEGSIALYKAAEAYDEARSKFSTFASLCIRRKMISWVEKNVNPEVSNRSLSDMTDAELLIISGLSSDFEEKVVADGEIDALISQAKSSFSKLECSVFDLFVKGFTNSEICSSLSITNKQCENAVFRIRKKLRAVKK